MVRQWQLIVGMVLVAAMSRLIPHPPNFAGILALSVFAGAKIERRLLAVFMPVAAMALSDLILGMLTTGGWNSGWLALGKGFYAGSWQWYSIYALIAGFAFVLRRRETFLKVAGVTFVSSLFFFIASNFLVWFGDTDHMYEQTLAGLIECYVKAIPFFRNQFVGDAFYAVLFFGGYSLMMQHSTEQRPLPATTNE